MVTNLSQLPSDLPVPVDDGAAAHLEGLHLPNIELVGTDGLTVKLESLKGKWVIYIYPMTGQTNVPLPVGWDAIPGARGCTPQSCNFRDHYAELNALNTGVFGISVQTSEYQREVRDRLHLPFQLLSDNELRLKDTLRLPTFLVMEKELYKRLTLVIDQGYIKKVFYPVFPPDSNADEVLEWLRSESILDD